MLSDYHILVSVCNDIQTVAVTTHSVQDIPSEKRLGSLSSFLQRGAETKGEGRRPRGRGRDQRGGAEAKGKGIEATGEG